MIETGEGIDWATWPRHLAFATLVEEGFPCACPARIASAARSRSAIRFSTTRKTEEKYTPLNNIREGRPVRSDQLDAVGRGGARLNTATRWPTRTR
jgi:2-oxoglutarate dehydrogenase E1 component